ncbi:serine/threonine-protein kinase [Nocardiopsis changdeensis]|uniref:non-specific serine/threonine protein kinase n=1 Tax=Nocardiopsis changdeensis TaxID=2831969 RepID=A0ABX8BR40_9ACTN|nr:MULTISPECIES: serine/threonine-protein kinase [Nocardiopsis]QUX22868.1 serine/threonine protein kinase [Nocardiopsis changdeensis]QYX38810.1 serine/threonine protein kinase [Nocardiopsis sp. MT53]
MGTYEPSSQNGPGGLTGTVLSDRYRLEEQIGSGGMGTVWRATDTLLNRPVAVKLLHPSQMAEPTARQRFRTEGRITAGLSHPGIAQVFDYGEEDGRAYLIMELVVGEPLSQVLKERGGLTPDETLDFIGQAAQALAAAHARGVVHRDIKPGNLLVTGDGRLKLTDFGIARGDMSVTLTQTGMVMGTAQYISPEQASGRPATGSSDLYALGVVAYECLAGEPPFTGDSPVALALAHTRDEPPPLPDHVPADLDDLVFLLLCKDPEDRPASAGEVAHMAAVIRSNAGTGPPTPSAGFGGVATTRVAAAVPDAGRTTGATPRRTTGQQTVTPGQEDDSARLASQRRIGLPVILAALGATVLIVAAVLGGFFLSGNGSEGANNVRDTRSPAVVDEPSSSPSSEPVEEETADVPAVPDYTPDYTPTTPEETPSSTPEPTDGETDPGTTDPGEGGEEPTDGETDPGTTDPGEGGGGGENGGGGGGGGEGPPAGGDTDSVTRP